jgi:DNA-binding LytR/AlgR family response regulator
VKVVIIEDEELAARKLQKLIQELDSDILVECILTSVKDAIKWLSENELPDLIFSDIQLGDGLSFEIFKSADVKCPVVFTTAFDQYAIQAFEVNSVDYLLKPVKRERIEASLEKYRVKKEAWESENKGIDVESLLMAINEARHNYKSRFLVKIGNKIHSIKTEQIAYFFSDQKLTFLVDRENNKYPVDHSLEEIGQQVDPEIFFRINRKYLIHLDAAVEIHPYFKGRLKLNLNPPAGEDIVVSAETTPRFKSWLDR